MSNIKAVKVDLSVSIEKRDNDDALKAIASAVRVVGSAAKHLQKAAVIAIGYANIHGDVTIANKCYKALLAANDIKGIKLQSWVTYLEQNGAMIYNKGTKLFAHVKEAEVERDIAKLVIKLAGSTWVHAVEEKAVESIHDCMEDIKALLKKYERLVKDGVELESEFVVQKLVDLRDYAA